MVDDGLPRRLPPLAAVALLVVAVAAPAEARSPLRAQAETAQAPAAVGASRGLVVVLSPDSEDEVTRNAMARIRGELGAAPFTVINRPLDAAVDVMSQLETAGQDLAPVAAFAIVRDPTDSPQSVAVWVSNRITRTTSVHRVAIRAGDVDGAAAELAIEAVELVRASMPGLWPSEPPAPEPTAASRADEEAERRAITVSLSIGAGVVAPVEDAPLFFAPTMGVSIVGRGGTGVRAWALGLGPGAEVSANGVGARLQRAAVAVGALHIFRAEAIVQPMLSLGAGVHYLHVRGTGAPADRLNDLDAWSVLAVAGAGLAFVLGPHVALTAEVEAMLALPPQVIQIDGADIATFRWPSLFVHGGVLARL